MFCVSEKGGEGGDKHNHGTVVCYDNDLQNPV